MIEVYYKASFVRQFQKLEADLQEEVLEKVNLFRNKKNHKVLKVHKLQGRLKDLYSFSVNYRYRIVFEFKDKNTVTFLAIGDHDVYK